MIIISVKFWKSQMSAGCFKKILDTEFQEFIFFQKTIFGFPPLWVVAMRKILLPFLLVCYSLLGISFFW